MNEDFLHEVGNYFTKEEWEGWVKGEVNLFELFAKKTGMTKEEADRIRQGKLKPKRTTPYKEFLKNPLDITKK